MHFLRMKADVFFLVEMDCGLQKFSKTSVLILRINMIKETFGSYKCKYQDEFFNYFFGNLV